MLSTHIYDILHSSGDNNTDLFYKEIEKKISESIIIDAKVRKIVNREIDKRLSKFSDDIMKYIDTKINEYDNSIKNDKHIDIPRKKSIFIDNTASYYYSNAKVKEDKNLQISLQELKSMQEKYNVPLNQIFEKLFI